MKLTKQIPVVVEPVAVRCTLPVNYDEDDMPNDYPFRRPGDRRNGEREDVWTVVIDIETGRIRDWPKGVDPRELHMKVCDGGIYELLGADGSVIASQRHEYVPSCIPGEYGDYIDFKIDGEGRITNWKGRADEFQKCFFSPED